LNGGFFDKFSLHTEHLDDGVAEEPTASNDRTAAAKQNDHNDADDETLVVLLGLFFIGGDRHFRHDDFSFYKNELDEFRAL